MKIYTRRAADKVKLTVISILLLAMVCMVCLVLSIAPTTASTPIFIYPIESSGP